MISLRRTLLIVSLLALAMVASCSSCDSCSTEEDVDSKTGEADVGQTSDAAEDTRAEDLEEATKQAEELADSLAFNLQQKSRMLCAEIEGMQKDVEGPTVKGAGGPAPKDEGNIDVAAVQKVFKSNQSILQKCYERALKRDPALQGQVVLTVRIGQSGKPLLVKARSQAINDAAALSCMEREANTWRFPRPKGGTVMLNKPIRFTSSN